MVEDKVSPVRTVDEQLVQCQWILEAEDASFELATRLQSTASIAIVQCTSSLLRTGIFTI